MKFLWPNPGFFWHISVWLLWIDDVGIYLHGMYWQVHDPTTQVRQDAIVCVGGLSITILDFM